jgi:hypothetical protein
VERPVEARGDGGAVATGRCCGASTVTGGKDDCAIAPDGIDSASALTADRAGARRPRRRLVALIPMKFIVVTLATPE